MDLIFPIPWAVNGDQETIPQYADANGNVSFQSGFGPDYEKSLTLDPDSKNIERKKLNYILNRLCTAVNALSQEDGIPVGMPIPWPSLDLPSSKFTYYDGRDFTLSQNPKLAVLFPGGKLADFRGVVIRGLDMGRGLDPNRVILSYQDDAMQRLTGIFPTDSFASNFTGVFAFGGGAGRQAASGHGSASYCSFDNARQAKTANENRMKNIALRYITKVG